MRRGLRTRILWSGALYAAVCAAACSRYVGGASMTGDGAPGDFDDGAQRCALAAACDPVLGRGCAAGARCQLVSLQPWTVACAPPGPLGLGAPCDSRSPERRCAEGLQCLGGHCLRPCCVGDDAACRARSTRSACAVTWGAAGLAACTVPGDCAWEPNDTCPEGAQCFPTSARGESVCLPYGLLRAGAACAGPGCGAGLTCAPAAGDAGVCRPVCVPRDSSPCARGQCRPIEGLPNNYGACDG